MHYSARILAVAAGLAAFTACGDGGGGTGTGKAPSMALEATGFTSDPRIVVLADGGQSVACLFTFSVTATGDANALATWTGATLRFYAGADRTTPIDSLTLSAAEMAEEFGAPGIRSGERRAADMGLVGSIPFGMDGEFRYRVQGSDAAGLAKAYVPCVVPTQDPQSTPPTLSGVTLTAAPGPLEPGDTVRVSWKAQSTTGLWETGAVVSGAFDRRYRVPAAYSPQLTHTAVFVVPANARLGERVSVQVYAVDLLARGVSELPILSEPVVDVTVPFLDDANTTGSVLDIRGQFPAGDGLEVDVSARDNHQLAYVVYEVGPVGALVRDSTPFTGTATRQRVSLRTRPEWVGEGQVRLYVRDQAGNRSRTVQSAPGAVRFHPLRHVTVRSGTLAYQPAEFAMDTRAGQLYVAAKNQPTLFIHSLETLGQVAAVSLPVSVSDVDVSPAGDLVVGLVPSPAALVLVDVAQRRVRATVPLTGVALQSVEGVRVAANGRALVLGRRGDGQGVVLEYDLATGAQRVRADAPSIPVPDAGVTASLDKSRLLLGAGCLYRSDTDSFGACATLWPQNTFSGVPLQGSGTGAFWAKDVRVFDSALQPRATVPERPVTALSADDRHAYVGYFDRVRRVRTADGVIEDALAAYIHFSARASADGRLLVSMETHAGSGNSVQVMELP